ncbi:MAG TPA: polysaccharide biosynthesis C-terminal domain-containing protein [Acidimicrobiales bacterium]|nr:polysaccharide biosynthesis C-terminal domain-containing protein [Acidimicrobiales bacterium]
MKRFFLLRRKPKRAFLVGGRVVASAISALWIFVAARLLGLDEFADFALGLALAGIAVQVADMGVGIQLPLAFSSSEHDMPAVATRQAFLRRLIGAAFAAPFLVVAFVTVSTSHSVAVASGFAVSSIATSVYGAGYVGLRAAGAYGVETVLEPAGRVLVLAGGAYLASSGWSLSWIAWSYALADLTTLCVVGVVVARRCRVAPAGPRLDRLTWLIAAGPIGMVYWRVDIWLLAALATSVQVALYGSAYRLLDAALLPALVVAQLFPAPFARCPRERRREFVTRWVGGAALILLPFTLVVLAFAEPLLSLLFGEPFVGAANALRLLAIAAPLSAAVFVLTTTLATLDARAYIYAAGIALVVNVIGNMLLLPRFGASGAAAMTVASQAGLVCSEWMLVRRRLRGDGHGETNPHPELATSGHLR